MTSGEIKNFPPLWQRVESRDDMGQVFQNETDVWLKEIAYQLARINERHDKGEVEVTVHQP